MMDFSTAARLLKRHDWTYAKTMPESPHWYTLRKNWTGSPDSFEQVVQFIRDAGHVVRYKGSNYIVLRINEHQYWTMGAPLPKTTLINRARLNEETPYDKIAPAYEGLHRNPKAFAENREIFKAVNLNGESVLDVGCGTGLFLEYLEPHEYVGIDPSHEMLWRMGSKYPRATTIQTPLESFHCEQQFGLVVSLFGAASYIAPDAVERAKRWVAPGGRYFLMFYRPGYVPQTHVKTGVQVPFFPYTGPGREFGDFIIVEGTA